MIRPSRGMHMENLIFIEWDDLQNLHKNQLGLFGGQDGFVDEGVVRSAMARAQFTAQYNTDADIADFAAEFFSASPQPRVTPMATKEPHLPPHPPSCRKMDGT